MLRSGTLSILLAALSTLPAACSSSSSSRRRPRLRPRPRSRPASTPPAWTRPSRPATTSSPTPTAAGSKATRDPGRPVQLRRLQHPRRPDPAADRALIQDAGKAGAGRQRRGPEGRPTTTPRFMDEAGIEAKGLAPLKPELDAHRRASPTGAALARALGGTLRADVDALNATNFYTDRLFGLWVAQDLQRPGAQHAVPAAGRPRPAGPRLLPRRRRRGWPSCARRTRRTSPRCSSWRASPTPSRAPRASSRWRRAIAEAHATRRAVGRRDARPTTRWTRDALATQGARPRLGGASSTPRACGRSRSSSSGSRRR